MERERLTDSLMNGVNALIILVIVLLYVVTGTGVGDDAIAALSSGTVYRGKAEGLVALECAVSWEADALSDMLDCLKEHDVRITFFTSGEWAKANADMLQRIVADGHEVGTMGYMPMLDGDEKLIGADLEASTQIIANAIGAEPTFYYSGLRDREVSLRAANAVGLTHVLCTSDLLCARGTAEQITSRASDHVFDGSIVLFQPTAAALEALPDILNMIRTRGYTATTVGNVLKR